MGPDGLQGRRDRPGMAARRPQQIQRRQGFVHPHAGLLLRRRLAHHQGQMRLPHGPVAVDDQVQLAHHGLHALLADTLDHAFVGTAVGNQVGDGADLQAMPFGKADQVGKTRHRAVFLHDLADDGRRGQAGERPQVAPRFRMAGPGQHATGTRHHRKDVPRLHDVGRFGIGCHGGLDGLCPVGGRDAGGHPFGRLDGHGEVGAHLRAVDRCHQRQAQAPAAFLGQRQADQPPGVGGHEVDGLGRDEIGRQQQVALVLAVFVIDEDDHLAGPKISQNLGRAGHGRLHLVVGHGFLLLLLQ